MIELCMMCVMGVWIRGYALKEGWRKWVFWLWLEVGWLLGYLTYPDLSPISTLVREADDTMYYSFSKTPKKDDSVIHLHPLDGIRTEGSAKTLDQQ